MAQSKAKELEKKMAQSRAVQEKAERLLKETKDNEHMRNLKYQTQLHKSTPSIPIPSDKIEHAKTQSPPPENHIETSKKEDEMKNK